MSERQILQYIMAKGFDHLSALAQALGKIQKESQTEDDVIKHSATLSMVFRAINDIIHPGYGVAQSLFPEQDLAKFLDELNKAHQDAVERARDVLQSMAVILLIHSEQTHLRRELHLNPRPSSHGLPKSGPKNRKYLEESRKTYMNVNETMAKLIQY